MEILSKWWPLLLVIGAGLVLAGRYFSQKERLMSAGLYEIDRMSKAEFQKFCVLLLQRLGYKVRKPSSIRHGVHFIIEIDGQRSAVLVKQYTQNVGARPVEKVARGAPFYRCSYALVITNRYFTKEAQDTAETGGVELWNRDKMTDLLLALRSQGR